MTTAVGAALAVAAPDQNLGSNGYRFNNWSDGGARSHIFTAPSAATTLNATLSAGAFVPSLDVDNDGTSGADSDGVLLLRYLFGLRGPALVANVSGSGAERDATAIASYLAALGLALDVDNNQSVSATTDGLLVLRYLLGLRGSALISNAVAANALRTKAVDIEAFLANLLP